MSTLQKINIMDFENKISACSYTQAQTMVKISSDVMYRIFKIKFCSWPNPTSGDIVPPENWSTDVTCPNHHYCINAQGVSPKMLSKNSAYVYLIYMKNYTSDFSIPLARRPVQRKFNRENTLGFISSYTRRMWISGIPPYRLAFFQNGVLFHPIL